MTTKCIKVVLVEVSTDLETLLEQLLDLKIQWSTSPSPFRNYLELTCVYDLAYARMLEEILAPYV